MNQVDLKEIEALVGIVEDSVNAGGWDALPSILVIFRTTVDAETHYRSLLSSSNDMITRGRFGACRIIPDHLFAAMGETGAMSLYLIALSLRGNSGNDELDKVSAKIKDGIAGPRDAFVGIAMSCEVWVKKCNSREEMEALRGTDLSKASDRGECRVVSYALVGGHSSSVTRNKRESQESTSIDGRVKDALESIVESVIATHKK